jgi:hypothetical protein
MVIRVIKRVQIAFWDLVIYALSDIKPLRQVIANGYNIFENLELKALTPYVLKAGVAGFCFGILLYIIFGRIN